MTTVRPINPFLVAPVRLAAGFRPQPFLSRSNGGDVFVPTHGQVQFGALSPGKHSGVFKISLGLAAILGACGPIMQQEGLRTLTNTELTALAEQAQQTVRSRPLTQAEIQEYQRLNRRFRELEAQAPSLGRSWAINGLKNDWNHQRNLAMKDDYGALTIVRALWLERMYDELTNPHANLIRFNYDKFDNLASQRKSGQLTQAQFATEVQWRALSGIFTFLANAKEDNPLVRDVQRFFEPTFRLVRNNNDHNIQRWGHALIRQIMPSLSQAQQERYIRYLVHTFQEAEPGTSKLSAMQSVANLYNTTPNNPLWNTMQEDMRNSLAKLERATRPQQLEEQKYYITLLGIMRDSHLTTVVEPFMKPTAHPDTQRAVAWTLGRVISPKGLNHLKAMLDNPDYPILTREMAMYSLGEYARHYPDEVNRVIESYRPGGSKYRAAPQELRDAAYAMYEKINDRAHIVPDFYLNRANLSPEEKAEYTRLRDHYVVGINRLNMEQKNVVDRSLLPYRQFLEEIVRKGGRHYIIDGNITESSVYKHLIGVRNRDGRLYDFIGGVSSKYAGAVTGIGRISLGNYNTFGHEFIHHLHQLVLNNRGDEKEIIRMYRKALEEQRVLDYYGAGDEYEYLGQGGEAMDGVWKFHYYLYNSFFNNGYDTGSDNIRSKLRRMDPELFEYLKSLRSLPLEVSLNLLKDQPELQLAFLDEYLRDDPLVVTA